MNIHLVQDSVFINKSIERFEQYYPNQNLFIVQVPRNFKGNFNHILRNDRVEPLCMTKRDSINRLSSLCSNGDSLFVHYLNPYKAYFVLRLLKQYDIKIYWLFYGADLYSILQKRKGYNLFDNEKLNYRSFTSRLIDVKNGLKYSILLRTNYFNLLTRFFTRLDFFCFWNNYDFILFNKWIKSDAKFKYFRYFEFDLRELRELSDDMNEKIKIFVNNSASIYGNHITLLEKIKEIDEKKVLLDVFIPLSYGNKEIKNEVIKFINNNDLNYCTKPVIDYLPKNEYFKFLSKIDIALFGQKRQEGGNNIYYLLASGAKIFLRKENNLLLFLKEKGYKVYVFEEDLNSISDFRSLTIEEKSYNRNLVLKEFSQDEINKTYKNLL